MAFAKCKHDGLSASARRVLQLAELVRGLSEGGVGDRFSKDVEVVEVD